MIDLSGMVSMPYLKKSRFTGSYKGMRYALHKLDTEESGTFLEAVVWPEPYGYDATPAERKCAERFSFDGEGLSQAVAWLNEKHRRGRDKGEYS